MCWCECVQILCQEMSVLISFIIPYHNEPQWMLDECIASIEALDLLPDEYEVLVEHDVEDEGPSLTRNRAIEKARGEYIQFVDCDDRLFPASYARIIAFIREKRMDMLMFRFSSTDRERVSRNGLSRRWNGAEFLVHNNLRAGTCMYVFKREVLGDLRFCPDIFHEDTLFTPLLIMRAKSLYVVKERAYFYRQHEGTTMSNRNPVFVERRLNDAIVVLRTLRAERERAGGIAVRALRRVIDQQVMSLLIMVYQAGLGVTGLRRYASILRKEGFMPLPLHCYNWKYYIFALVSRVL